MENARTPVDHIGAKLLQIFDEALSFMASVALSIAGPLCQRNLEGL
jgi:hypothetical protein